MLLFQHHLSHGRGWRQRGSRAPVQRLCGTLRSRRGKRSETHLLQVHQYPLTEGDRKVRIVPPPTSEYTKTPIPPVRQCLLPPHEQCLLQPTFKCFFQRSSRTRQENENISRVLSPRYTHGKTEALRQLQSGDRKARRPPSPYNKKTRHHCKDAQEETLHRNPKFPQEGKLLSPGRKDAIVIPAPTSKKIGGIHEVGGGE